MKYIIWRTRGWAGVGIGDQKLPQFSDILYRCRLDDVKIKSYKYEKSSPCFNLRFNRIHSLRLLVCYHIGYDVMASVFKFNDFLHHISRHIVISVVELQC